MTGSDDMSAGLPSSEEFNRAIEEKLASSGVSMRPAANPDRTRVQPPERSHETMQRVTGATKPGLFQNTSNVPPYVASPHLARASFPWIGVLGSAQAAGHEVSVHLRQDPVIGFRGHVVDEPKLTDLDEVGAASIKTVKLERDTGNAPRREITTILVSDIVAVTTIEKIEKKS